MSQTIGFEDRYSGVSPMLRHTYPNQDKYSVSCVVHTNLTCSSTLRICIFVVWYNLVPHRKRGGIYRSAKEKQCLVWDGVKEPSVITSWVCFCFGYDNWV